jgi:HAD superfamily hydrolase (TIGR01509 family)
MRLPGVRSQVRTVLLDIDGTLIDSNDAHAHAWVDALTEAGYGIPFERIRPLIGMGADQLLPALRKNLRPDINPGRSVVQRRGEIFKRFYLPGLEPARGARALLTTLQDRHVMLVAATSSREDELDAMLSVAGISDLIAVKTTAGDVDASKPAADIVRAAMRKAGSTPDECVLLGDTRFDIAAATRAGVETIALRCGGSPDGDLLGAAAIYDDPAALADAIRLSVHAS